MDPTVPKAGLSGRLRTVMRQPGAAEAFLNPGRLVNAPMLDIALKALGWSRSDLAARMGFNRTHVSNVINGRNPLLPDFRMALWETLGGGLDPRELFLEPAATSGTESAA